MTETRRSPVRGAVRDAPDADQVADQATRAFLAAHRAEEGTDLVVIIPALDERGAIGDVVSSVPGNVCGVHVGCLVIDDGSTDDTAEVARRAGALVCSLQRNLGQGRALRVGYRLARVRGARFVATIDADGQFDPVELERLVAPLVEGRADFVNGSRRLGRSETDDRMRSVGLRLFAWLVTALTRVPITDPANGFRAFRAEVVAEVPLRQTQYQTPELLIGAIKLGFRVEEVPVTVRARSAGESKKGPNLLYGARFARTIAETWLRLTLRSWYRGSGRSPG
jgi:glycosyltransferase involved in cell wall biosynthesis